MKTILVPTDFSYCAENATDFAVHVAKLSKVEIIILHVFNIADKIYPDTVGVDSDYVDVMLNEVRSKLNKLKADIKTRKGVDVSVILYEGDVTKTILDAVHDNAVDLIVMGTTGASGAKEVVLGSETAKVIGKTKVPVMVVPVDYGWKKPEKILLATNHFEQNADFLNALLELTTMFSAELKVVVFTELGERASTVVEHIFNALEYERMLKNWFNKDNITVREIPGNDFEESLEAYMMENDIDCLVMVTYKRNLWERLFHPSITKKMSYHTKIPLLVIPG